MRRNMRFKGSVLIVEDMKIILDAFCKGLSLNGFLPLSYLSGRRAIKEIKNGLKYGLAIFDRSLDVDGGELINVSREFNPDVKIITISGYNDKPKGSYAHYSKPLSIPRLIEIVEEHFPDCHP